MLHFGYLTDTVKCRFIWEQFYGNLLLCILRFALRFKEVLYCNRQAKDFMCRKLFSRNRLPPVHPFKIATGLKWFSEGFYTEKLSDIKVFLFYQNLNKIFLWQEDLGEVSEKEWEQAQGGYM